MVSDYVKLLVAQTTSSNRHEDNIGTLEVLAAKAKDEGCNMLCLPEASGLMNQDMSSAQKSIVGESDDPYVAACASLARKHKLWIHNGSTPVLGLSGKPVNRTLLFDASGNIVGRYDKIHLFDIFLPDGKERLESKRYDGGEQAVVVNTPWGPMGLTICYDLRFPHLYRDLAQQGARVIFVPSAFMRKTGEAHWEVLLQARAIENGCFIVAAAQTGEHADGRKSYGHSLVVHPWGQVLLDMGLDISAHIIELDLSESNKSRKQIPALSHTREYSITGDT